MTAGAYETQFTTADGCRLAGLMYSREHASARFLCLHGLGVDANAWRFTARALWARGFEVFCPDLRGHGCSESGAWRHFGPDRMALDVVEFCRARNFAPTVLMAQSFGNWVGLPVMLRYRQALGLRAYIAVTPTWYSARKPWRAVLPTARETARLLVTLRRRGAGARASMARREHGRWAGSPDWHLPRILEEARQLGWSRYAALLVWLQWRGFSPPDWQSMSHLPVQLVAAGQEGMWNNREIDRIHALTGWTLHRMNMRHVSLATSDAPTAAFVDLVLGSIATHQRHQAPAGH